MPHDNISNTSSEGESEMKVGMTLLMLFFNSSNTNPKKSTRNLHMWYLTVLIIVPFKQKAGLFERNNVHTIIVKVHSKATGIEVIV